MSDKSAIEWTDATWTPIRARNRKTGKVGWYCEHATPGCVNCYAESFNARLGTGLPFKPGHRDDVELLLDEKMLLAPLRWKRPRMVFVCSMTDLFADFVPDAWIDRIFAVMALAPQHTFQVLTKRAERMRTYLSDRLRGSFVTAAALAMTPGRDWEKTPAWNMPWPLPNVWLGVSAEDQRRADERIPHLLATSAAVRFISAEPLLGPIDLTRVGTLDSVCAAMPGVVERENRGRPVSGPGSICGVQIDAIGAAASSITFFQTPDHMGGFTAASPRSWPCLDWVVVGGESGRGARTMHPQWARSLRDQCEDAGVAFFFKQWGECVPAELIAGDKRDEPWRRPQNGAGEAWSFTEYGAPRETWPQVRFWRVGKKAAGRLLDGVEYNGMPEARP
ncbi:MAG: phage Gp37/Gp68 family protein [Rhizobiales bacterium]|nr:phage Gp37/Gp68 family protein [Hyphomicrobiales bacterium]